MNILPRVSISLIKAMLLRWRIRGLTRALLSMRPKEELEGLDLPWCKSIMSDSAWKPLSPRDNSSVEIFNNTLWNDRTIRVFISL